MKKKKFMVLYFFSRLDFRFLFSILLLYKTYTEEESKKKETQQEGDVK